MAQNPTPGQISNYGGALQTGTGVIYDALGNPRVVGANMPTGAASGNVLASDANGYLTLQASPVLAANNTFTGTNTFSSTATFTGTSGFSAATTFGAAATFSQSLTIPEGSNAYMGTVAVNGVTAVTVATTAITANSRIFMTINVPGGTPGSPYVFSTSAATNFVIKSQASDTSTVAWLIVTHT